jgi:hypothetical protein
MAPAKTLEKSGAGWVPITEGMGSKQQGLRADNANGLVELDTGSRQDDDMRGNEMLTFGTVIDVGLRSDGKFAFYSGVGVDHKLKLVGILVAI